MCRILRSISYYFITFDGCPGNQLKPQNKKKTLSVCNKIMFKAKSKTAVSSGIDASNDVAPPLDFSYKYLAGFQGMSCDFNQKKKRVVRTHASRTNIYNENMWTNN